MANCYAFYGYLNNKYKGSLQTREESDRAPKVSLRDSGYRQYSEADVRSLQFIKRGRELASLLTHCQGDERPDCPILDDLAGRCC